ncbi:YceI family protein [Mucilaginibacter paludis]|uniref:YceI family protein n=1 Tax=Mucilaginibacter paludis DSM 18603 TaxID=714943 RepID=H1Y9Y8_9SPHI|nr:YceI family protein [Mucilaginibacter paludis]EHQ24972.1 YceI family protein [Mucilaginibacter paludis DSM 18603]
MKKTILLGITALLCSLSVVAQHKYLLDKYHARVGFSATHFGISHVEGNFKTIDATLTAKKADFTDAVITFTADVNSINTDVDYRDKDLKSAGYFNAEKYPTLSFKSTSFKKTGPKSYKLAGNITIHGVTKAIVFNVIYNGTAVTAMKKPTAGFTITGKLNRLDFGVGTAAVSSGVSNEIELRANIEFTVI